jgi:membrane-associated protease RseP (regulator of RpoE activity)
VKIFGENPDDESISGPDSKRSFVNKPWYIQASVLFAGVAMNFLGSVGPSFYWFYVWAPYFG